MGSLVETQALGTPLTSLSHPLLQPSPPPLPLASLQQPIPAHAARMPPQVLLEEL